MQKNYQPHPLRHKFLFLLSFISISAIAQAQELSGLWMGELENDSTHKKQRFELALSEYRGKVSGYSYTTFIEQDHYYYSVKRIRATKKDDHWEITDDKMVANNFPEKAAKGVSQTTTFTLNKEDSTWKMNGKWRTNKTKTYYSIGGNMQMSAEKDYSKSSLFPHLGELRIDPEMSFYKPGKLLTSTAQFRAEKNVAEKQKINGTLAAGNTVKTEMPATSSPAASAPVQNNVVPEAVVPPVKNRTINIIETVFVENDSLSLSLYDNGEIDGDTVSVFLNGAQIIDHECLKAISNRKTIQLPPGSGEDISLVLVAENLGKYPPNTGLLVVRDGDKTYQIRFSADLEKSPAIVFKRKKSQ